MTRNEVVKLRERLQSCSEEMKVLKNNTKSEVSRRAVGLKPGMSRCGVKDESLRHRCNVRDESLPHRCESSRCCDVRDKSSSHSCCDVSAAHVQVLQRCLYTTSSLQVHDFAYRMERKEKERQDLQEEISTLREHIDTLQLDCDRSV